MTSTAPPDPARTVAAAVAHWAGTSPGRVAFRFPGRHEVRAPDLTWSGLDRRARIIAAVLRAHGLVGEPVMVFCPSAADFVPALAGCLYAGALAMPAPTAASRRAAPRIEAIIRSARPRAILSSHATLSIPWVRALIAEAGIHALTVDDLAGVPDATLALPGPEAPAILQFTSGTTGGPRGIVLTNANLTANAAAIADAFEAGPDARFAAWLPLHHDMGLILHVVAPMWSGASSALMDPLLFLQRPLRWLEMATAERATVTSAPNFAFELAARAAEREGIAGLDLSHLAHAICGAEPVLPATIHRFCRVLAPAGFRMAAFAPSYGLAEATLLVSPGQRASGPRIVANPIASASASVSVGPPATGVAISVVDPETRASRPEGEVGEIEVRGPTVGRPRDAGRPPGQPDVVRTGDLGFMLDGELFICGRLKDLIIVRGENVDPAEIEAAALAAGDEIAPGGLAAFGISADATESMGLAFEIARNRSDRLDLAGLRRRVSEAVTAATGHVLAEIVAVRYATLPRTTSGKVRRRRVAELHRGGALETVDDRPRAPGPRLRLPARVAAP